MSTKSRLEALERGAEAEHRRRLEDWGELMMSILACRERLASLETRMGEPVCLVVRQEYNQPDNT